MTDPGKAHKKRCQAFHPSTEDPDHVLVMRVRSSPKLALSDLEYMSVARAAVGLRFVGS